MTTLPLYTGNGKSYSIEYEEGMHRADKTRCIADEGKILTLDDSEFYCRDILNERVEDVVEIDDPEAIDIPAHYTYSETNEKIPIEPTLPTSVEQTENQ